jgi:hypothetical protein
MACPTELDRTRLLDMEARIARPRALMYAALAVGLSSAIPWVGCWPMVPLAVQLAIYAALSPLVAAARGAEVSYDALCRAADAALYEAKRAGRDRVVVDGDAADVRLAGGNVRRRAA